MQTHYLTLPLNKTMIKKLHCGDLVYLSGVIYGARDQAHKRLVEMINEKEELPFPIQNSCVYYFGPSATPPGEIIGSAGPTTGSRMDKLTPPLLEKGLLGTIGKGQRSQALIDALVKYGAVYFAAIGGTGALIAKTIKKTEIIAFKDLGTEAIRRLEVENFKVN